MPPGAGGGRGGPGVRFHSAGFGPGFGFGGMNQAQARARAQQQQQQQRQQEQGAGGLGQFIQLLPLLVIFFFSFFNMPGEDASEAATGGSKYFSLTRVPPYVNPLSTRLSKVKDIPFFVTDRFLRTYNRDRYQLAQVENLVERSYERYLVDECKNQKTYKQRLEATVNSKKKVDEQERSRRAKKAAEFELTRCIELEDLYPAYIAGKKKYGRWSEF